MLALLNILNVYLVKIEEFFWNMVVAIHKFNKEQCGTKTHNKLPMKQYYQLNCYGNDFACLLRNLLYEWYFKIKGKHAHM